MVPRSARLAPVQMTDQCQGREDPATLFSPLRLGAPISLSRLWGSRPCLRAISPSADPRAAGSEQQPLLAPSVPAHASHLYCCNESQSKELLPVGERRAPVARAQSAGSSLELQPHHRRACLLLRAAEHLHQQWAPTS
jgi:hypothetical protein